MLKTPDHLTQTLDTSNPILAFLAGGGARRERHIEEGVVEIGHFSLDMLVWGRNSPEYYMGYPEFAADGPQSYGVCDTPDQFLTKFRKLLQEDDRTFVIGFTHIAKDPTNRGQGGGWRWHKWGPYIGEGTPQFEYLDDEDGFEDGVYVFHILQTEGPEKHLDWSSGELRDGPRSL